MSEKRSVINDYTEFCTIFGVMMYDRKLAINILVQERFEERVLGIL